MARKDRRETSAVDPPESRIELIEAEPWPDDEVDPSSGLPIGDQANARRPRWVVPTFAALLLVAGGAIVVSTTGDDGPAAAVPTTRAGPTGSATTVPDELEQVTLPTLAPAEAFPPLFPEPGSGNRPGSVLLASAPKYVVTVPPQFNVSTAYENDTMRFGFDGFDGQLWADEGATARTGRWFTLWREQGGASRNWIASDAYRRLVGDTEVVVTPPTTIRPTTLLNVAVGRDSFFVEAFGMSEDDLDSLVEALTLSSDFTIWAYAVQFRLLLDGSQPRVEDVLANETRVLTMVGPNAAGSSSIGPAEIELSVDRIDATNRRLEAFVLTDIRRLAIGDDSAAIAGNVADTAGTSAVIWVDRDGWEITLTGALPVEQMIDLARTARVDDVLWEIFRTAPSPRSPVNLETADQVPVTTITAQALPWTIGVTTARDTVAGRIWVSWWTRSGDLLTGGLPLDATKPTVTTSVYEGITFVYASAPAGSGATTLRLEVVGALPRDIPMTATTTEFIDLLAGATAFEEIAKYSASILDASGNVLATFPAAP